MMAAEADQERQCGGEAVVLREELLKWLQIVVDGCADEDGIDGSWGDKAIRRIAELTQGGDAEGDAREV